MRARRAAHRPLPREATASYLTRLAATYQLTPAQLLNGHGITATGTEQDPPAAEIHPSAEAARRLSRFARIPIAHLARALPRQPPPAAIGMAHAAITRWQPLHPRGAAAAGVHRLHPSPQPTRNRPRVDPPGTGPAPGHDLHPPPAGHQRPQTAHPPRHPLPPRTHPSPPHHPPPATRHPPTAASLIKAQANLREGRHALARKIFHGRSGQLYQRYQDGMEDQIGALGLVLNAVVLFNTRYMDAAVNQLRADGFDVADEDVARLSPFVRHHINMLGRYSFQLPQLPGGFDRCAIRMPLTTSRPVAGGSSWSPPP